MFSETTDWSKGEVFAGRHISLATDKVARLLDQTEVQSIDELINETVPPQIRLEDEERLKLDGLPEAKSEVQYIQDLHDLANQNRVFKSYIGLGYYPTVTPPVIQRNIFQNPGWYTQYTPYQAEISQGRLEALLNFQTVITSLTGLELTNASLLDEATAAAEAMHLLYSTRKNRGANVFLVSDNVFPQTRDVLEGYSEPLGIEVKVCSTENMAAKDQSTAFGALIQFPDSSGRVEDHFELAQTLHRQDIGLVVAADLLSLVLLEAPGKWGADIVIGSTQRFGVPMGFGGPHAAFFATREEYKRNIPGRIIGVSIDAHGDRALRMALQTREQHIKRDKATSNICTAQALLAVMAGMYAVWHGPNGLRHIATRVHGFATLLSKVLQNLGYTLDNDVFFDTLSINLANEDPELASSIKRDAIDREINFRYDAERVFIALNETVSLKDIEEIVSIFARVKGQSRSNLNLHTNSISSEDLRYEGRLARTSELLSHPIFNTYHTEHEMLRYIKELESKDLSLTHSMIPLGSCTMKLNATTEMLPVTWPEFADMHPFAPSDQTAGYLQLFKELESWLCSITGFAAMSLQPNSGAQGEYTGLRVIRAFLQDLGQTEREIVLIPSSAHGTNPASAVIAGFKVIVVACDSRGNIDVEDLKAKAEAHSSTLAALMITYPSTHGVFEEGIREICAIIHEHGGQVYMDGANMNAQVGLTSPGKIGADVCHLNLHKTFCIPHGGGGPGIGPIGVARHLAPYLPGHSVVKGGLSKSIHAVSAASWGSASVLVISHAYISLMGAAGLILATKHAILNANYIKSRLEEHYPILYAGSEGHCAHEMILDCRAFKSAGIEVVDIAKRLIDYGFHAPTVSFPVSGTLMIEPTESESVEELDRFCDALISIRKEIEQVSSGQADRKDNVLKNAPHTSVSLCTGLWHHPYSREQAAYPLPWVRKNKFWPAVGRLNETQGDRVLICSCPPIESYEQEEATVGVL